MTPAHQSREHRWRALVLVAAVIVVVALLAGSRGTTAPVSPLVQPVAQVAPADAESSSWYCIGQSTASGQEPGYVVLTNTTATPVAATVNQESDGGSVATVAVSVPARGAVVPTMPAPASGSWLSETVSVAGGGVAVSQVVSGPSGWTTSPCQSTTSATWYFAGGTTVNGDVLQVALLNPTSTPVVADLSFVTPSGVVHPINYQGIVLQPDQVVVENVASEIQDVPTVSTTVTVRTGRVVATEMQTYMYEGSPVGLAVVPGANAAQPNWFIPQSREVASGASTVDVYNPTGVPERARVDLHLASGPLTPLSVTIAPGTTWVLPTSAQSRIPVGAFYSVAVSSTGGPGVVVARAVRAPTTSPSPQAGMATASDGLATTSATGRWVIAPPGTSTKLPVAGARTENLAFMNTSATTEHFSVHVAGGTKDTVLVVGSLRPGATAQLSGSAVASVGVDPVFVQSSGPMAVSADMGPSGMVGVVTMPGIPLAAPVGI